jgi:hypothetical protein
MSDGDDRPFSPPTCSQALIQGRQMHHCQGTASVEVLWRAQRYPMICRLGAFCVLARQRQARGPSIYKLKCRLRCQGLTVVLPALEWLRPTALPLTSLTFSTSLHPGFVSVLLSQAMKAYDRAVSNPAIEAAPQQLNVKYLCSGQSFLRN